MINIVSLPPCFGQPCHFQSGRWHHENPFAFVGFNEFGQTPEDRTLHRNTVSWFGDIFYGIYLGLSGKGLFYTADNRLWHTYANTYSRTIYAVVPDSGGVCSIHGGQCIVLLCLVFFLFRDQILSITPKTQEQVDILKNVSTQYEVDIRLICELSSSDLVFSCESLCDTFSPRQAYGSLFHLSTSKRKLRSTCLFLQTAPAPSRISCGNTP